MLYKNVDNPELSFSITFTNWLTGTLLTLKVLYANIRALTFLFVEVLNYHLNLLYILKLGL